MNLKRRVPFRWFQYNFLLKAGVSLYEGVNSEKNLFKVISMRSVLLIYNPTQTNLAKI